MTWVHAENIAPDVTISFNPNRVLALTGLKIPEARMQQMLEALGMRVSTPAKLAWQVIVPSYRFDIRLEVDVVEEITRLHGYDKLTPEVLNAPLCKGQVSDFYQMSRVISTVLTTRGYHELMSYSFVDPVVQAALFPGKATLQLANPLSAELSEMRLSLWPGLISALLYNASRQQEVIRCFETGTVFEMQSGELQEHAVVSGLMTGEKGALSWAENTRAYDFYDMKGDVQVLAEQLGQTLRFVPEASIVLHPGKSARLYVDKTPVGWMGVLHPALLESLDLDLKTDVMLFEIAYDAFKNKSNVRYQAVSKYPQVRRDLSLLMDEQITLEQVELLIRSHILAHTDTLKSFNVFDQYTGEQVPSGKKSLAIALVFQDAKRTLTEQDITPVMTVVIEALEQALAIQVRE